MFWWCSCASRLSRCSSYLEVIVDEFSLGNLVFGYKVEASSPVVLFYYPASRHLSFSLLLLALGVCVLFICWLWEVYITSPALGFRQCLYCMCVTECLILILIYHMTKKKTVCAGETIFKFLVLELSFSYYIIFRFPLSRLIKDGRFFLCSLVWWSSTERCFPPFMLQSELY